MQIQAIGVSQGIVVGKVFLLEREGYVIDRREITADKVDSEIARLMSAIQKTSQQIKRYTQKVANELGQTQGAIFEGHALILEDPMLIDPAVNKIKKDHVNAEHAIAEIFSKYLGKLEKFDDPYLKARMADFRDVGKRIQMNLAGVEKHPLTHLEEKVIVVSYDLSPSDTATMDRQKVIGFVTEVGSRISHTAIMAKALEIPAVVGATGITNVLKAGDTIILDGTHGTVLVNPDRGTLKEYQAAQRRFTVAGLELEKTRNLPAETLDGIRVKLSANIELEEEIEHVKNHGAKGIGLFRTEFMYLHREGLPTEEDLFKTYRHMVKSFSPETVTIRTLDIGGDKFASHLNLPSEMNPFLGCRAIRLCLQRPDLFKPQLRAILRASIYGNVKLMFPMVSTVNELRQVKEVLNEVKHKLKKEGIEFKDNLPVGIMIEIPSAAIGADILAKESDFFSIGTNDLIQYTMAVDRGNEHVAYLYDPLHPPVLRLIKFVIESAHREGIPVSMCGEMAGDPAVTSVLLGMGLDEFSMAPSAISQIKNHIRNTKMDDARKIAQDVMELSTADEIREYLGKIKK